MRSFCSPAFHPRVRGRRPLQLLLAAALLLSACWTKEVDTPNYTQTTSYYCGAASVQMILNSRSVGIFVSSQDTLYNYVHSHNQCPTGWASDPKGLSDALNHFAPGKHFLTFAQATADDGIKRMAYTLDVYGVPPAAMVYGCAHWVVVRGAITDVEPKTAAAYTIDGFYVNDPWYGSSSLGENKYVAIASWKSDYFTGCSWCGASGNAFLSIDDPRPVPNVTLRFAEVKPRRAQVIAADQAARAAQETIQLLQKAGGNQAPEALQVASAAKLAPPALVKRSDRAADGYYVVPLVQGSQTAGAVLIDAYSGQLKEATYVQKPIEYLAHLDAARAAGLFRAKIPELKVRPEILRGLKVDPKLLPPHAEPSGESARSVPLRTFRQLRIDPKEIQVARLELVWEPSAQSQNPYYPLWRAVGSVRHGREQVLGYLDAQGQVFPELVRAGVGTLKGGGAR